MSAGERSARTDQLLGLRNLLAPPEQPFGALAACRNVDHTDSQGLERRDGYTRVLNLAGATDVFSPATQEGLYVVAGGVLTSYGDDVTPTVVASGLTDTQFAWAELDGRVLYAGATDAGAIVNRTTWQPLRVPVPETVAVTAVGGSLPAGRYTVAVEYRHLATGLVGGASYGYHTLASAGGLGLSVPAVAGYGAAFYVSPPDGETPWYVGASLGEFECTAVPDSGLALDAWQREAWPLPAAPVGLACAHGRLYAATYDAAADTSTVWWSAPFALRGFRLATDWVTLHGAVLALHGAPGNITPGLLIGTAERIFAFDGESLRELAAFGVVPGRPFVTDRDGRVVIWTTRGVCVFPDFTPLQVDKVAVAPGTRCTLTAVARRGRRQALVVTDGGGAPWNAYG